MKKPSYYYVASPLADREALFDEAFQRELLETLEAHRDLPPRELASVVWKLFWRRYELRCRW